MLLNEFELPELEMRVSWDLRTVWNYFIIFLIKRCCVK